MARRIYWSNSAITVAVCNSETEDDGHKEDASSFDSLPNDIITNILLRLPSQSLYNSTRFVCKAWFEISQLHSDHRLLLQEPRVPNYAQFVHIKEWEIKVADLTLNFPGKISGSSDGVLLINKRSSYSIMDLYVANPTTKQVLKLPLLPSTCRLCGHCNNIASISSTGEIKVVILARDPNGTYNWYAITVQKHKAMSWRKIISEGCDDPASYLSFVQSLSCDGVVYWTNASWIMNGSILAIDLRNETARNLKIPAPCSSSNGEYWTLVQMMWKKMCLMNCGKNLEETKVWMLKELHRNEWVLGNSVSFCEESPSRRKFCMPLVWLDSQVLVLSVYVRASNVVVADHVGKGEYRVIKIDEVARHPIFHHTTSLKSF